MAARQDGRGGIQQIHDSRYDLVHEYYTFGITFPDRSTGRCPSLERDWCKQAVLNTTDRHVDFFSRVQRIRRTVQLPNACPPVSRFQCCPDRVNTRAAKRFRLCPAVPQALDLVGGRSGPRHQSGPGPARPRNCWKGRAPRRCGRSPPGDLRFPRRSIAAWNSPAAN
jgi:hypothetical protein